MTTVILCNHDTVLDSTSSFEEELQRSKASIGTHSSFRWRVSQLVCGSAIIVSFKQSQTGGINSSVRRCNPDTCLSLFNEETTLTIKQ